MTALYTIIKKFEILNICHIHQRVIIVIIMINDYVMPYISLFTSLLITQESCLSPLLNLIQFPSRLLIIKRLGRVLFLSDDPNWSITFFNSTLRFSQK